MTAQGRWSFADPKNVAVITLKSITKGTSPILYVTHDADDGAWQFLDGSSVSEENASVVCLETITRIDSSVVELADLPLGWYAYRSAPNQEWQRTMSKSIPDNLEWLAPWVEVADGIGLEAILRREIADGHPLYDLPAVAVGRRIDCDDVVFRVEHPSFRLAVVHLTWRRQPESDPTWPQTVLFANWDDWIENCMGPDHAEYRGSVQRE
jgi:hypothetical protein